MSESRTLRDRQASTNTSIDRLPANNRSCADCQLVTTTKVTTYPTTAGAFFACNPTMINGPAQEGGAATYVPDTNTILYCWNSGSQIPPQGTRLIAHSVAGTSVFSFNG